MSARRVIALAMLSFATLAGCDQGSGIIGIGGSSGAKVRFVNATGAALDLTSNGQVVGGSGHIPAGAASACLQIDPARGTPGLRESGGTLDIPNFAPAFVVDSTYTVIAFPSAVGGVQVATLSDASTPAIDRSGLRIFDAAPGLGILDLYVVPVGEPLTTPLATSFGFGGSTGFLDVGPGTSQVRFTAATTLSLVFDAGTVMLSPGRSSTLVLAQPAGEFSTPVALLAPGC